MEELSYYLSFTLNALFCGVAIYIYRKKVNSGLLTENKAKNIYSLVSVVTGVSGGTLIFHGLIWLFSLFGAKSNSGHGEIIIAAVIYNMILGLILLGVGRIIIGWKKLTW